MFGVVSLTMGNSLLPLAHRRNGDAYRLGQLLLRQPLLSAVKANLICHMIFHTLLLSRPMQGDLFLPWPQYTAQKAKTTAIAGRIS